MVRRLLVFGVLVAGVALTVLGLGLVINVLSLRDLVEQTRLHPAIAVVFEVRDALSHRLAQGLELMAGLIGLSFAGGAAFWLRRTRKDGYSPGRTRP